MYNQTTCLVAKAGTHHPVECPLPTPARLPVRHSPHDLLLIILVSIRKSQCQAESNTWQPPVTYQLCSAQAGLLAAFFFFFVLLPIQVHVVHAVTVTITSIVLHLPQLGQGSCLGCLLRRSLHQSGSWVCMKQCGIACKAMLSLVGVTGASTKHRCNSMMT